MYKYSSMMTLLYSSMITLVVETTTNNIGTIAMVQSTGVYGDQLYPILSNVIRKLNNVTTKRH